MVKNLLVLIDEGKYGVSIVLDLRAAYDSADHSLLFQDCPKNIEIEGGALDYMKSFLGMRIYRL